MNSPDVRFEPTVEVHGPVASHNMPCCLYRSQQPAVLNLNCGVFEPSWKAQSQGYILIRVRNAWLRNKMKEWFSL